MSDAFLGLRLTLLSRKLPVKPSNARLPSLTVLREPDTAKRKLTDPA